MGTQQNQIKSSLEKPNFIPDFINSPRQCPETVKLLPHTYIHIDCTLIHSQRNEAPLSKASNVLLETTMTKNTADRFKSRLNELKENY